MRGAQLGASEKVVESTMCGEHTQFTLVRFVHDLFTEVNSFFSTDKSISLLGSPQQRLESLPLETLV